MKFIIAIGKAVTAVLALAGGFLNDVVPPVGFAKYVIGFSQMVAIIITYYALQGRYDSQLKKIQSFAALTFIVTGVGYYLLYSFFVFDSHGGLIVIGYQGTQELQDACRGAVTYDCIERSLQTPNVSLTIFWTRWSILLSEIVMIVTYIFLLSGFVVFAYASIDRYGLRRKKAKATQIVGGTTRVGFKRKAGKGN